MTSIGDHKRGEPWFEDGNIVLVTQDDPTVFRIHRGVLVRSGRHSEIFDAMFTIPQPMDPGVEWSEGCQVVTMYDSPSELSNLILALYDGATFRNRNFEDFLYLAGILRLSTKYFIAHLRTQAIRCLLETWPYTLQGHDAMVLAALETPSTNNITYPYVHPLHVLNLAREVNVQIVVPSALYFLSLYPLDDILRADHPKLLVEHPSRPSSSLSPADIKDYSLVFQYRISTMLDFVRQFLDARSSPPDGSAVSACNRGFSRLASRLSRSWLTRTGPLYFMVQAIEGLSEDPSVCLDCRAMFRRDVEELRQKIWNELPSVAGLASWAELKTIDLPE